MHAEITVAVGEGMGTFHGLFDLAISAGHQAVDAFYATQHFVRQNPFSGLYLTLGWGICIH